MKHRIDTQSHLIWARAANEDERMTKHDKRFKLEARSS
jgi:hypothetical protein